MLHILHDGVGRCFGVETAKEDLARNKIGFQASTPGIWSVLTIMGLWCAVPAAIAVHAASIVMVLSKLETAVYDAVCMNTNLKPVTQHTRVKMATMFGQTSKVRGYSGMRKQKLIIQAQYNTARQQMHDPEMGYGDDTPLLPGMGKTENMLRWGFIRKVVGTTPRRSVHHRTHTAPLQVYGIVASQLVLTALVSFSIVSSPATQRYLVGSPGLMIAMMVLSFLLMIPLYMYKVAVQLVQHCHEAQHNNPGQAPAQPGAAGHMDGPHVPVSRPRVQRLHSGRCARGAGHYSCHCCGPDCIHVLRHAQGARPHIPGPISLCQPVGGMRCCSLSNTHARPVFQLVIWGFFQMFFPVGPVGRTIYALIGAVVFSGYIVFDTHLLIARFDLDGASCGVG